MKVYRISTKEYISDISGTVEKLYGGRWNNKGTEMLYFSENISLSILEILVHFDGLTVPNNPEILQLEISTDLIENYSIPKFNKIRTSKNAEYLFKEEGQKWIDSVSSLALKAPSIIAPYECNILINPNHTNIKMVEIEKIQKLILDKRLFKKGSD